MPSTVRNSSPFRRGPWPSAFTISIDHLLVRDARYRLDEHWEDMTSGFTGRASNVWVGTKKCVLYFRCFGPQKWIRPAVFGEVDGDTEHSRRHHHRADGVPGPVFSPTGSSVHRLNSCDGSWAIGVQVNVWRTFRIRGKYSAPDDVTCNIPGCGSKLGRRRNRADCFNICRQRERSEKLDRSLVRNIYSNTLAYRWTVWTAASNDSPSLIESARTRRLLSFLTGGD